MTRAIVLSGGGACGAFQAGVLSKLNVSSFDAAYGTSSGALNAALFSYLSPINLLAQWAQITSIDSVYQFNGFKAVVLPGLYNNSPLISLAENVVNANTPKIPVTVTYTDLSAGQTVYATTPAGSTAQGFATALADSATIPVLACDASNLNFVDGGVMCNLPMERAIDDGATDVTLVLAIPYQPGYEPKYTAVSGLGADINQAVRCFDLLFNAQIWSTIAALAPRCKTLTVYAPSNDSVLGNPLDFSQDTIQANIALGNAAVPVEGFTTLARHKKILHIDT